MLNYLIVTSILRRVTKLHCIYKQLKKSQGEHDFSDTYIYSWQVWCSRLESGGYGNFANKITQWSLNNTEDMDAIMGSGDMP